MEAVLTAQGLKPFTRALIALSKYGDDLDIHATPDHLSLSSTNSSKSAYGRFRLLPHFFEKYSVGDPFKIVEDDVEDNERVDGQILVKSILSILRPKNFEKTVERCEFSILPGQESSSAPQATGGSTSTSGSPQSILLVRLHCKYGITKTHRLSLNAPPVLVAPHLPVSPMRAHAVVGPKAVKDLIEHFSKTKGKGVKATDIQLTWAWSATEVVVKTLKGFSDRNTDAHISTSIAVQADEFDSYDIPNPPVSLSFHLREFIAATGLAESLSLQLNLSFTAPAEPLSITIDADAHESLFVIATKSVPGAPSAPTLPTRASSNKRPNEADPNTERRKSMKVVTVEPNPSASLSLSNSRRADEERSSGSRTPVKSPAKLTGASRISQQQPRLTGRNNSSGSLRATSVELEPPYPSPSKSRVAQDRQPLFLSPSQPEAPPIAYLSQQDQDIIRASGLGIEAMTSAELAEMLDYDGEEDELAPSPIKPKAPGGPNGSSPTKPSTSGQRQGSPDWDMSELQGSEENSRRSLQTTSIGRRSSVRFDVSGLSEEALAQMDLDVEDDESVPLTQMPVKVAKRGQKVYRPLAFKDS